jgi:hypothetical protein
MIFSLPANSSNYEEGYFPFPTTGVLPSEITGYYEEHGFVVLTGYIPQADCARLFEHGMGIANALQPTSEDLKQQFEERSLYLARSASSQLPFFYPEAYRDGHLVVPAADAVYLIGNDSAVCDDYLRELTLNRLNRTICQSLGYQTPQVNQSQLNYKSSAYSGVFLAHQDQMFSPTLKFPLCTFTIPFAQTTKQNGCLLVLPGSHKTGPLMSYLRMADNIFGYFDSKGDAIPSDEVTKIREGWQSQLSRDLPVPAGSLIILHGCTIHGSNAAENGFPGGNRVVYTFSLSENGDQNPRDWNYNPDYPLIENFDKL